MPSVDRDLILTVTDPDSLADACEREALLSSDGFASFQDAVSISRQTSIYDYRQSLMDPDLRNGAELEQEMATGAFHKLQHRAALLKDSYPFEIEDDFLTVKQDPFKYSYPFLMALSHTVDERLGCYPTRLFEQLCTAAASSFVGGRATHFGWPRMQGGQFYAALVEQLDNLGEGRAKLDAPKVMHAKDGGLDIIAWRDFPDLKSGKLIAIGQCAAGNNWRSKTQDLIYDIFANHWLSERFSSDPIRLLFIPRLIPNEDDWLYYSAEGSLLFDRFRIAHHVQFIPDSHLKNINNWTRAALKSLVVT